MTFREMLAVAQGYWHYGQVIDIWLSHKRDLTAARQFLAQALALGTVPSEVTTDRAPVYPRALDELAPGARHVTQQYANNAVELTMAVSQPGFDRCVASSGSGRLASSPPVMPSSRTCGAVTTR